MKSLAQFRYTYPRAFARRMRARVRKLEDLLQDRLPQGGSLEEVRSLLGDSWSDSFNDRVLEKAMDVEWATPILGRAICRGGHWVLYRYASKYEVTYFVEVVLV